MLVTGSFSRLSDYSPILTRRRRGQELIGVMEKWSFGVLGGSPTTPILHHVDSIFLSDFHIPAENPFARQRSVIDVFRHAEEQLMAPHELSRRLLVNQSHRLA